MSLRRTLRAGVSLSLSGAFRRQGEQALAGLRLWLDCVTREGGVHLGPSGARPSLELLTLDDQSRASDARENVRRLLAQYGVDILIGPYSSGLTLAVAPLAEGYGKILWNHGGASDAIFQQGWRRLVSVPSPASDYFRRLPAWMRKRDPAARRLSVLYSKTGSFSGQVADGLVKGARAAGFDDIRVFGFERPIRDPGLLLKPALDPPPDLVVGVGSFRDDVALVRRRPDAPSGTTWAVVAAGLAAFQAELGDLAEGVLGPSQWEPTVLDEPRIGPESAWFSETFQRTFHLIPEYPAAQAFALGIVLAECLRRAGTVEDGPVLRAAQTLETTTLYGGFRLDPVTGRQVGHRVHLVEWRGGRKAVLD